MILRLTDPCHRPNWHDWRCQECGKTVGQAKKDQQRLDPEDGRSKTFSELVRASRDQKSMDDIREYWEG